MKMKTFLVEVELHDQSTIDPDEVLSSIQKLLEPIDAHDPLVRVVELEDVSFEGRTRRKDNSVDIHRDTRMFTTSVARKMKSSGVSVSALVKV